MGTAAAEGLPAPYCSCDVCRRARQNGGRDVRLRSSILIDRAIRIDQSPDTVAQAQRLGVALDTVHTLVVTHTHEDHLYADDMLLVVPPFTHTYKQRLLVLGPGGVAETLLRSAVHAWFTGALEVRPLTAFVECRLPEGYVVVPLLAAHAPERVCFNYLLTDAAGATILYAADTGVWPPETFEYLERSGRRLDTVIMEATKGHVDDDRYKGHLSVSGIVEMRRRLIEQGNVAADTPYYATHFSHGGGMLQADLEAALKPHNIVPAFDGLGISVVGA